IFASYKGKHYEIKFEYRDPWESIRTLLDDETLGSPSIYNSIEKYYCEGTIAEIQQERVIDEPNTADTWAKFESELPKPDPYPHCLMPLHFWIDDGMVTKHISMKPMVFRVICQPSNIRNASGNGGRILGGYIPPVCDPSDPTNRNTPGTPVSPLYKKIRPIEQW
ncbi:hypothetical protein K438DRAFT_1588817, partial [Mycena galopus ATCC 62051]